jgi:hypothetical protein
MLKNLLGSRLGVKGQGYYSSQHFKDFQRFSKGSKTQLIAKVQEKKKELLSL